MAVMGASMISQRNATRFVEYKLDTSLLRTIERSAPRSLPLGVRRFSGYEEFASQTVARTESATAEVVLIFELAPALSIAEGGRFVRHHDGFIAGLSDAPTRTLHNGYQSGVQVNLSALSARRLLGIPLAEIAYRNVAIADVLSAVQRDRLHELIDSVSWDQRLDAVEALVALPGVRAAPKCMRELAWVIDRIERSAGAVRIAALARELGWAIAAGSAGSARRLA